MNTKNLKAYAPKARRQFMQAVETRLAWLGIYPNRAADVSMQGESAIIENRAFSRKQAEQRNRLLERIQAHGFDLFVREMAYTWFNRLAAIRYMELKGYLEHGFRVLSHPSGDAMPEIIDHAAAAADTLGLDKKRMMELQLAGDQQEVLYRELLLAQCHYLHDVMPFMFEAIDDATELLLPDNLTKTDSLLKGLVQEIPEEDWANIEVIGWLYQFYISEHKEAVIGKVVKSEDIPAATQLFTPNWIVKYLVQNSLGRQWLQTYPDSAIKAKMEYFISPCEQPAEVLAQLAAHTPASIAPETIKVLDPACGSGHILVEVYELLREIYLDRGYRLRDIPLIILSKNIYGLDIDDRAAQLAAFALMMKAREDDRRIFERVKTEHIQLNIFALQPTAGWQAAKLWQALNLDGKALRGSSGDLFAALDTPQVAEPSQQGLYAPYFSLLQYLTTAFAQAKTLGSLVQVEHTKLEALRNFQALLQEKLQGSDPSAKQTAAILLPILQQAIVLAQQYDAVIANPPYMGSKYYVQNLKDYLNSFYNNSKNDLYTAFIQRNLSFIRKNGFVAMITIPNWMFLSSFKSLRELILEQSSFQSLVHNGRGVWGSDFGSVSFVIQDGLVSGYVASFLKLFEKHGDVSSNDELIEKFNKTEIYKRSSDLFKLTPDYAISYWVDGKVIEYFNEKISKYCKLEFGIKTGDNDRFLRYWFEIDVRISNIIDGNVSENTKWIRHNKGGRYKKWTGNTDYVIDWSVPSLLMNVGNDVRPSAFDSFVKPAITWSEVTMGDFSTRLVPYNVLSNNKGPCAVFESLDMAKICLAFTNTSICNEMVSVINPSSTLPIGDFGKLPFLSVNDRNVEIIELVDNALQISLFDEQQHEFNFSFKRHPLVVQNSVSISDAYEQIKIAFERKVVELAKIEEQIEVIFCRKMGVDVSRPLRTPSLDINPAYNYHGNISELDSRFQSDLVTSLISFIIGCVAGRYSLDREGLIYAHSGNEGFNLLVSDGAYESFSADIDGIMPMPSEEWVFEDDVTARIKEFVKNKWGLENLENNLSFLANSICLHGLKPKTGENAINTVRRYLSTQFYKDHLKTYKKRPIYWLFSSGKEKAFECLVYLHRYNESTLARMRTEYVTPLMGKYDAQQSLLQEQLNDASPAQQRDLEKQLKDLAKKQTELRAFDENLKHYADMRIKLDLDDGVKVNYGKFGNLLADVKAITGDKE